MMPKYQEKLTTDEFLLPRDMTMRRIPVTTSRETP